MNLQMYNPLKVKGGGAETKRNNVNRIPKITIIFMDQKDIVFLRNPQEFRIHIITLSDNT